MFSVVVFTKVINTKHGQGGTQRGAGNSSVTYRYIKKMQQPCVHSYKTPACF